MIQKLAIFCGSGLGNQDIYQAEAYQVGKLMAERGIDVVYGGGKIGLMGTVANAAIEHGGRVTGVIPEKLMTTEIAHSEITELLVVKTMHERKAKMAELADGFVALPGGIGTLEEIIEVFTWHQIGYHQKPCAFLNTDGYYDKLFDFIDQMVNQGFLPSKQRKELIIAPRFGDLLERIA